MWHILVAIHFTKNILVIQPIFVYMCDMHASVYVLSNVYRYVADACVCTWGPKVDVECLPQLLSSLDTKAESLT